MRIAFERWLSEALGQNDLGREHEALVAEVLTSAERSASVAADVGVPVAEVEGDLLDRQRKAGVPVVVLVVRADDIDEVAVVGVALLPAERPLTTGVNTQT